MARILVERSGMVVRLADTESWKRHEAENSCKANEASMHSHTLGGNVTIRGAGTYVRKNLEFRYRVWIQGTCRLAGWRQAYDPDPLWNPRVQDFEVVLLLT